MCPALEAHRGNVTQISPLPETHSFTIDSMPRVAWKSFTEARALVRGLGLKSVKGWGAGSKSEQRPSDIPAHPEKTYCDDGWVSWPDWLGRIAVRTICMYHTIG